ncbi:MAG TPA: phosphate acyltransferase, partial [Saccharofermentans sp.]|nr:phosphate acyltransferase [Saccharofermentans sp.]
MAFIDEVKARAKADKKTIILPESMDRRTFEAAAEILAEDIADIVIIGSKEECAKNSEGLDISKAVIVDPNTNPKTEEYINGFVELRKSKGMTKEEATKILMNQYMYYACMMVKMGDGDGIVSGACHSTADTLRPSLQIIKTKPGTKLVSAFFVMVVPDCGFGNEGTFVFGDCALNQNPSSEELAAIAGSSADS